MRAIIVGGGIFGVTAARELSARGADVVLIEQGAVPNPLAESTDISKAVRMDYGADEDYVALMEGALPAWREWNERFGETLFHETGVLFLGSMELGSYERTSFDVLARRGHALERLTAREAAARFPAFSARAGGYFNPQGGWAAAARTVAALADDARRSNVAIHEHTRVLEIEERAVRTDRGRIEGDHVIVAAGAWALRLLELPAFFRRAGQPVFHLRADADVPVFAADVARTGWYGFPPRGGIVKIANHGRGRDVDPDASRDVFDSEEQALRSFLEDWMPGLARADVVARRTCIYCDTLDEHFFIARHPERGLTVATGGSGHAFKFAPLLGRFVADAVLGSGPGKFRWRPDPNTAQEHGIHGEEAARKRG